MTQQQRARRYGRSAMALAVYAACAAFAGAQAQDKKEGAEAAPNPVSTQISVEAGAAGVSGDEGDRAFWGRYNGMRNQDAYGILNIDYSRRDASTGTWLDITGTSLGLQTREVGLLWARQGDWALGANYGELRVFNPYTVNTAVSGTGSTTPTANYLFGGPGSGGETDLSTKRRGAGISGSKWLGEFQLEANVNSEQKTGAQLFGIGNTCTSTVSAGCSFIPGVTSGIGILYFPQPIDYRHTQVEARVNYMSSSLQLSGGYYGSFFNNDNGSMTPGIPGTLNNAVGQPLPAGAGMQSWLGQAVALPPENSHNGIDITGSYLPLEWLRANFKLSYSQTRQDSDFASAGLTGAPAGVGNLDGQLNTTIAQVRVIANPIPKLSLVAEYRYTDNEDDTPLVAYNQVGTIRFTNQTTSRTRNDAKLEATYRFPWQLQGSAGVGYTTIDRSYAWTASYSGISATRDETDETSWWLSVRRSLTQTISGSLTYEGSKRDGSDWLAPGPAGIGLVTVTNPAAQLGPNAIYMPTLADRDRTKVRALLNWMATDALTLQFSADFGRDDYDAPTRFALQETRFDLYGLDVTYQMSENWSLNGYLSGGSQKLNQYRPQGYILAFDDKSFNAGVGANGKVGEKWQLGGLLSWISNTDTYEQTLGADATPANIALLAATGGLPDITYRRFEVKLYGSYSLSDRSTLRATAAYQRLTWDDWGYTYGGTPFLYSDNTTVGLQPNQNVGYFGVSYVYALK